MPFVPARVAFARSPVREPVPPASMGPGTIFLTCGCSATVWTAFRPLRSPMSVECDPPIFSRGGVSTTASDRSPRRSSTQRTTGLASASRPSSEELFAVLASSRPLPLTPRSGTR